MAGKTNRTPSNTLLQGKAREVRRLLGGYVNLHTSGIQADPEFADWPERSAGLLRRAQRVLAELRALDSRHRNLEPGLRGTAYERAHCLEVEGEDVYDARRRGSAAEEAEDLAEALRRGDVKLALRYYQGLAQRLDRMALREVAANLDQARKEQT